MNFELSTSCKLAPAWGHFIENAIDEKGKTTYIWQELEHNH